jgi:hypothetical protein
MEEFGGWESFLRPRRFDSVVTEFVFGLGPCCGVHLKCFSLLCQHCDLSVRVSRFAAWGCFSIWRDISFSSITLNMTSELASMQDRLQ